MCRTRTCEDEIVGEALRKLKEKEFNAAIDLMSHALCTRQQHADFYWVRGVAKWRLGKVWDDPQWYQSALEDFRDSTDLDPSPIVKASELSGYYLPQHWWALPAYKKILEGKHHSKCQSNVAFALVKLGVPAPGFVDAILSAIDQMSHRHLASIYFGDALRVMGWPYLTDSGQPIISDLIFIQPSLHQDAESVARRREVEFARKWLEDPGLLDGDDMLLASDDAIRKHSVLADAELKTRLNDSAPLHRAVSLSILAARGAITLTESFDAMSDRHRCVRVVAIRAIGLHLPRRDSTGGEYSQLSSSLIDKGMKDKSYHCRQAALETIDRWAESIKHDSAALENLWNRCEDAVSSALGESQRNVVIAAIQALSTFGLFASKLIDWVEAITVATYKGGDTDTNAQLTIARCVFALSTGAHVSSRRQHWQTVQSLVTSRENDTREKAISTVKFLTKIDPSLRDEIRPLLRERSWMDDSKAVRDAADLALKSME